MEPPMAGLPRRRRSKQLAGARDKHTTQSPFLTTPPPGGMSETDFVWFAYRGPARYCRFAVSNSSSLLLSSTSRVRLTAAWNRQAGNVCTRALGQLVS